MSPTMIPRRRRTCLTYAANTFPICLPSRAAVAGPHVLRIPYDIGLNDEKGPVRRVERTRRGIEAEELDEEGGQPD